MLLRRITEHVKDQNWFAVFIDFIIVVVGVFIGIQVSNWNEARGERISEVQFLLSLEQDIQDSIAEIDEISGYMVIQETSRQKLYEYSLGKHANLDLDEFTKLTYGALWSFPSVELRQTTFDTLRNSGRLGVLGDKDLVANLQELAALIDEAETEMKNELHVVERFGDPLLYEHVNMAAIFSSKSPLSGTAIVPWLIQDAALQHIPDIVKTLPFRNALLFRSALTNERIETYARLRNTYLEIGSQIDNRQAELGVK